MDKIKLSLSGDDAAGNTGREVDAEVRDRPAGRRSSAERTPLAGWFAVGFGLLGVFGPAIFFTPFAFFFSLIALLRGQGAWGFVGLLLVVAGFASSPLLMGLVGVGALYMTLDWQEILRPVYDYIGGGVDI